MGPVLPITGRTGPIPFPGRSIPRPEQAPDPSAAVRVALGDHAVARRRHLPRATPACPRPLPHPPPRFHTAHPRATTPTAASPVTTSTRISSRHRLTPRPGSRGRNPGRHSPDTTGGGRDAPSPPAPSPRTRAPPSAYRSRHTLSPSAAPPAPQRRVPVRRTGVHDAATPGRSPQLATEVLLPAVKQPVQLRPLELHLTRFEDEFHVRGSAVVPVQRQRYDTTFPHRVVPNVLLPRRYVHGHTLPSQCVTNCVRSTSLTVHHADLQAIHAVLHYWHMPRRHRLLYWSAVRRLDTGDRTPH